MREVLCEKAKDGRRYAKDRLGDLRNEKNDVVNRDREVLNDQKHAVMAAVQLAKNTYHLRITDASFLTSHRVRDVALSRSVLVAPATTPFKTDEGS